MRRARALYSGFGTAIAAATAVLGVAYAQSPAPRERARLFRVALELPATGECTDVFSEALLAKTRNVSLVPLVPLVRRSSETAEGPLPPLLHVRISQAGAGFAGRLDIRAGDAGETPTVGRELVGDTCSEVLRGLALVAALAIDPPSAPANPPPPRDASTDAEPDATANVPARSTLDELGEVDSGALRSDRSIALVAGAGAEVSSVAAITLGLGGFIEVSGATARGPALSLRVGTTLPTEVTSASGEASLSFTTGTLDGCPIAVPLTSSLSLRPCGGVTLGALRAEGSGPGVATPASVTRLWAAGRVSAWAHVALGRLALRAGAGFSLPITREELVFRAPEGSTLPRETVYRPPLLAAFGGAELGVRFW